MESALQVAQAIALLCQISTSSSKIETGEEQQVACQKWYVKCLSETPNKDGEVSPIFKCILKREP